MDRATSRPWTSSSGEAVALAALSGHDYPYDPNDPTAVVVVGDRGRGAGAALLAGALVWAVVLNVVALFGAGCHRLPCTTVGCPDACSPSAAGVLMTPVLAVESASAAGVTAFIVAVVGAAATFIVGVLNFRRQGQSLRQQETFQVRQLELARSAQLTDRFSRAIEQLGGSSNHVRMGGVFALERIARDSPDDRQHIVDTLAAFVRERLPGASVGAGGYVPILQLRAPDAQAALTVLCRSPLADERVASRQPGLLDLSRTDLRRANLRGARLDAVNLWGTRLEGADLCEASLIDSTLENANFGRFDPGNDSFMRGADLSRADLTGARVAGAYNLDVAVTDGTVGLES